MQRSRVLITRAAEDAHLLRDGVIRIGAEPICVPLLQRVFLPIDRTALSAMRPDWYVFTSQWAVDALVRSDLVSLLNSSKIAAVGQQTARALTQHGLEVQFTPSVSTSASLFQELPLNTGDCIVHPRGDLASQQDIRTWVPTHIRIHTPVVYQNVVPQSAFQDLDAQRPFDVVTLCSSSAASRFNDWRIRQPRIPPPMCIAIGPTTAATCHQLGLPVASIATPHTIDGVLDALRSFLVP